jgi:hypothetical protein
MALLVAAASQARHLLLVKLRMFPFFPFLESGASPAEYTYSSDADLTPSKLQLRYDLEQFVRSFELQQD